MSYLIDTNVCIALMKRHPVQVDERLQGVIAERARVAISSISVHELWFGVAHSSREQENSARLQTFLSSRFEILSFDGADARVAGVVRAQLKGVGKPIGPYDLLIAGQALRHGLTLVTANEREFARVRGLKWQNWAVRRT